MGALTIKLSPLLESRLQALAMRRGRSKSTLVREAIERLIAEEKNARTAFDLLQDLAGAGHGPKDLSSNPGPYMRGYGAVRDVTESS
jgi:predicted DNA-binding protein